MGYMMPRIETHCYYKHPVGYDDEIIVTTKMGKFKGARVVLEYENQKDYNTLIVYGSTVHAITDSNLKPINIKRRVQKYIKIYGLFIE